MPYRAYLVGVFCPLDELLHRKQAQGDRYSGTVAHPYERVHRYGVYDTQVDTSTASPEECAHHVIAYVNNHEPTAFRQLRANT